MSVLQEAGITDRRIDCFISTTTINYTVYLAFEGRTLVANGECCLLKTRPLEGRADLLVVSQHLKPMSEKLQYYYLLLPYYSN